MPYPDDTILELTEPAFIDAEGRKQPLSEFKPSKDASEPERLFPYNRVKVVGRSPINHGHSEKGWQGSDADGYIVQPLTDFAANLDEPYGKLSALYSVAELPDESIAENVVASDRGFHQVRPAKVQALTPEEVLRGQRTEPLSAEPPKRSGNVLDGSPLDEVVPPQQRDPLD